MAKARAYCFTINNYSGEDEQNVLELANSSKYIICGREMGEGGTPHLQGYVYFSSPISFTSMKKKLPRAHIEQSKGTPQDNKKYCSKQSDILIEQGEIPKQGARTDIERTIEQLEGGENMRAVVKTARSMQSIKVAEVYLKYHEEPRTWKPEVRWYYGSTGSGKTRAAREWLGDDVYTALDSIKWFEGYDKHESVLIDDFRKDFCKFHQLLKLLDRYEYRVETKGGSRQFLAKKIAVTAPYPPDEIYNTREDVKQLLRRIDEIILVGEKVQQSHFEEIDYLEQK